MDDKRPVGKALSADLHMALSELWQGEARSSWARGRGKKGHFIKKNRDELIIYLINMDYLTHQKNWQCGQNVNIASN